MREAQGEPADKHENVSIEIGASANPPGFDEQLVGLSVGDEKRFPVDYPADYSVKELAGTAVNYAVTVKGIKTRVVPALDDEFAKDLGEFDSLEALRSRVREDLQRDAERAAERELRNDLLKQLAGRVTFEIPEALLEREVERRTEEFVRRLYRAGRGPPAGQHRLAGLPRPPAGSGARSRGLGHRSGRGGPARAGGGGAGGA